MEAVDSSENCELERKKQMRYVKKREIDKTNGLGMFLVSKLLTIHNINTYTQTHIILILSAGVVCLVCFFLCSLLFLWFSYPFCTCRVCVFLLSIQFYAFIIMLDCRDRRDVYKRVQYTIITYTRVHCDMCRADECLYDIKCDTIFRM